VGETNGGVGDGNISAFLDLGVVGVIGPGK